MDTLTTPVLLRCMTTNSRRASVSIGLARCYITKATEKLASEFWKDIGAVQFHQQVVRDQFSARSELYKSETSI
jgi:hypothetical protein